MQDTDTYCDPTIETCSAVGEMHRYEEYEEYNRFLGQLSGFLALTPTFVFIYPTWLSRTTAEKDVTFVSHQDYLVVWGFFAGSHLFFYGPLLALWMQLGT